MAEILKNNIKIDNTYIKDLKVGSSPVKYVKDWRGNLLYDTFQKNVYGTTSITFYYSKYNSVSNKCPNTGGSASPTVSASRTYTKQGYSGASYTGGTENFTTFSYSIISGSSYASVSSNGTVTFNDNSNGSTRSCTVRCTCNGYTKDVILYQAGKNQVVTVSLSELTLTVTGASGPTVTRWSGNGGSGTVFNVSGFTPYSNLQISCTISLNPNTAACPDSIPTTFTNTGYDGSFHPALDYVSSPARGVFKFAEIDTHYGNNVPGIPIPIVFANRDCYPNSNATTTVHLYLNNKTDSNGDTIEYIWSDTLTNSTTFSIINNTGVSFV